MLMTCFCYLGETLDGDTARIRNGWMKEVLRDIAISNIQSSPAGDERSECMPVVSEAA